MRVEIEGKPTLEFPDGTDPAVIDAVVKRDVFGQAPAPVGFSTQAELPPAPEPVQSRDTLAQSPMLDLLQRVKGTPVAPGMPANVADMGSPDPTAGIVGLAEGAAATATGLPTALLGIPSKLGVGLRYAAEGRPNPAQQASQDVNEFFAPAVYEPRTAQGAQAAMAPALPYMAFEKGVEKLTPESWSPEAKAATKIGADVLLLFAPAAVRAGKAPLQQWYYSLTNKERGLIPQAYSDLKAKGYSDAQLARMNPDFFAQELAKRMPTEGEISGTEAPKEPAPAAVHGTPESPAPEPRPVEPPKAVEPISVAPVQSPNIAPTIDQFRQSMEAKPVEQPEPAPEPPTVETAPIPEPEPPKATGDFVKDLNAFLESKGWDTETMLKKPSGPEVGVKDIPGALPETSPQAAGPELTTPGTPAAAPTRDLKPRDFTEDDLAMVADLKGIVEQSKPQKKIGGATWIKDDRGESTGEVFVEPSLLPKHLRDQGITRSKGGTLDLLDRALTGKPMTKKQYDTVIELADHHSREAYGVYTNREEIPVSDLEEGQQFTRGGEKFKVTDVEDKGFPWERKVTVKDGITMELEGDQTIDIDKGSAKGGPIPIVKEMIGAVKESTAELRKQVSNVRYGEPGKILFEFKGETYEAPEPTDAMPAGNGEASQSWALKQVLSKAATKKPTPSQALLERTKPKEVVSRGKEETRNANANEGQEGLLTAQGGKTELPEADTALKLTPTEALMKRTKPKQEPLFSAPKGEELKAPERENKPVSMDETELGKATNEAKDREAQASFVMEKKEPWQMTREESGIPEMPRSDYSSPPNIKKRFGEKGPTPEQAILFKEELAAFNKKKREYSKAHKDYLEKSNAHIFAVKKALSEGKPVPSEVLKDYPELTKQEHLYTFPGPVGKAMRGLEKEAGKAIKTALELTGKATPPWVKETLEGVFGTPTGTTNRYPERKGIYKANIQRGESNAEEQFYIFSPDNTGYKGIDPIKALSRSDRKILDKIRIQADQEGGPLLNSKQLRSMGANDKVATAYYAERMMFNRLATLIAWKTEKIGMTPYEAEPYIGELKKHVEDIKKGKTRQGSIVKGTPDELREAAYKEKLSDPAIPEPVKLAIRHVKPFIDKAAAYLGLPESNPNYFPRIRDDGEFHVKAYKAGPDGKPVEVFMQPTRTMMGATMLKAKIAADPAKYMPVNYKPGDKITVAIEETKQLPEELYNDLGSHSAREAVLDRAVERAVAKGEIGLSDKEAIASALLTAESEITAMRGAGRRFLQRSDQLIEGYQTEDLNKALSSTISGIVGWLNKAEYAIRAMQEVKGLEHRYDKRWAHSYFKDSMKNMDVFDRTVANLRGLAVFNYLGGVGRSAVVNIFDQYQRAVPVFSKYTGSSLAQLERARKDVLTGNLTPEEKAIMDRLHQKGMDQAKLVRDISGSNDLAPGTVKNVVNASMFAFSWVEQNMNRKPAILASMRLFTGMKDKGGKFYGLDKNGQNYRMNPEEAEAKAGDFLDEAAGRYGRENRPEIVRRLGPLGSAVYTFVGWTAEYLNTAATAALHGEAGVLWRMFVAAALLGGLKAAPGADQIDEALAEWYGVPMWHRIRGKVRAWLKETDLEAGQQNTVEDFIMGGIPEAAGLSLSRSIGLNLPLISGRGDLSERMAGTLGSLGKKYLLSAQAAKDGDWQRSLEAAAPEGVANWLKAYKGHTEGVHTAKGYPLFDENEKPFKYTAGEAVKKGLGFTSPRESRLREADSELRAVVNFYEDKKRGLVDRWRATDGAMQRKMLRYKIDDLNKEISGSDAKDLVDPISESSLINAEMKREGTPARVGISGGRVSVSPDREEVKRREGRREFIGR